MTIEKQPSPGELKITEPVSTMTVSIELPDSRLFMLGMEIGTGPQRDCRVELGSIGGITITLSSKSSAWASEPSELQRFIEGIKTLPIKDGFANLLFKVQLDLIGLGAVDAPPKAIDIPAAVAALRRAEKTISREQADEHVKAALHFLGEG